VETLIPNDFSDFMRSKLILGRFLVLRMGKKNYKLIELKED
jgi:hypothetical protein